ncbi:MAG: PKD domain-containing protein [Chitinophagaceae bacterium]|nr:MAG: PKD domain-containing protein [Chitinophagaceae bacterium]
MRTGGIKHILRITSLYFFVTFLQVPVFSQNYILNGNATQNNCNCYTLTQAVNWQGGSVWNANKINLNTAFDFSFNVFLGCIDLNGADGIVFILQPVSTSLGTSGEGMGFSGVTPSIGISLDTWQNTNLNDPAYDHISIQANGVVAHGADLAGPIQASSATDNIEDCAWHIFRISWDPVTKWLRTYFDGVLRLEVQYDLIVNIFNNDPMVYWGFSAATGGANNLQQFCTALNPLFITNFASNATCFGTPVTFLDQSVSFAPIQSWYWDFGDASTSILQNPPSHLYAAPGIYEVKLVITGLDGCISDTLKRNIAIGSKPVADFQSFDTCSGKSPRIADLSTNVVGNVNQWTWILDGLVVSNNQQPLLTNLSTGSHQLKLVVKSVYNCESDTITKSFIIIPAPVVDITALNGCVNNPVSFTGSQLDNATTITQWNWILGDGQTSTQQSLTHTYNSKGNYYTKLWAQASNGCSSDTVYKTVFINKAIAFAGNDTIALKDVPIQLKGSGGISFSWSPPTGLDNPGIQNPVAVLQNDITYVLTVSTAEGCTDTDSISIIVFKGSAIYVPTAFTPNQDGKNDLLRPKYIGIKNLDYFRVYNRWGQLVFGTKSLGAGWDGRINGINQQTGTYVWLLRAEDIAGKIYEMKGTTIIIR